MFDAVRQLIASAPETPVRMTEQISNVMATQWVRGTDWALGHARAFHDEVRQRVDAGHRRMSRRTRAVDVGGCRPVA